MYFQSKLHSNSILTGSVDSYCLVCDNYLRSENEAYTHTEKPIHKKNMGAATRMEKFIDDQIIKVKKGYYCTFCNVLLSTTTKVGLHVNTINHQENKGAQMLTRVGDHVIAFGEIAISWNSWHGMTENTCVICNTEFDKEDVHRSEQIHILKLIQSKCEFGAKTIYRRVDDESFFCLICGSAFAISDKPEHHTDLKHEIFYNHGKELKKKTLVTPQVKGKKIAKIAPPTPKPGNGTKDSENVKHDKNSNAASSKKKGPKSGGISNKSDVDVLESTRQVNPGNSEGVDATNTDEVAAKKPKVEAQVIQLSQDVATNDISKAEDFFDAAAKMINTNDKEAHISDYLSVNNYIIQDEACQKRCILCDVICIKEEDLIVHLSNDLHHQMMLKKHKESLYKKNKGSHAANNEVFLADNLLAYRGKIFLDNPKYSQPVNEVMDPKPEPLKWQTASPSNIQLKIRQHNPDSDISSDEEVEYKTKILAQVDKFQKHDITIDISAEKAHCNKCDEDVPCDSEALDRHINKQHKSLNNNSIFKKPEVDMKTQVITYARENNLAIMQNEAYCKLCSSSMHFGMEMMVDHVKSKAHKDKTMSKTGAGPVKKILAVDFMQTFFRVESNLGSDVILNNKYVLRHFSFHGVTVEEEGHKCGLCDVVLKEGRDDLLDHFNTAEHTQRMGQSNVISSMPEEFIRELTSGKYHCGYCNKVFVRWPLMQDHLLQQSHMHARHHAKWNLERYHTIIRNARSIQYGLRGTEYNQPEILNPPPPPPQPSQTRPSFQYFVMLQELRASNRSPEPEEPLRPSSQGPQP